MTSRKPSTLQVEISCSVLGLLFILDLFVQWIHTSYNKISSCVLNNGFSAAPFEVRRGGGGRGRG